MGNLNRRTLIAALGLTTALSLTGASWAQDVPKVAAIWTVPVEQQWASRLHNALVAAEEAGEIDYVYSENITNTDYERVMREYAEQGIALMVGEAFGVEQPARTVAADYPEISFLMGSSLPPVEPNFATFDNFIHEPSYLTGIIGRHENPDGQDRHGGRLRHSRSEPADACVHGRGTLGQP